MRCNDVRCRTTRVCGWRRRQRRRGRHQMCLMTAGVFSTLQPRTQQPARAQPSFPAQASKLRALPKLLLLPPPSSVRRLRSSSFFTRNEKRRDRDARAVSNLFTEADSAPRLAAGVGLRRLLSLASRMEHERKEREGGGRRRVASGSGTGNASLFQYVSVSFRFQNLLHPFQ